MTTRPDDAPPVAGPYIQTVSGRWVNPFEPDPAQLDASDIARALANQCRFGGHSRVFYSVAQHSVIVSRVVEERGGDVEDVFAALMHDASEAYLGDMPHPIKHRSPLGAAFREAEAGLEATIRERFKILRQVRVYTAQGRLTMLLLMGMPPIIVMGMYFMNPLFIRQLFTDPIGHAMLVIGIVLQTMGYFVIRKIIRIQV